MPYLAVNMRYLDNLLDPYLLNCFFVTLLLHRGRKGRHPLSSINRGFPSRTSKCGRYATITTELAMWLRSVHFAKPSFLFL